jgi:hypothetical protein
MKLIPSFNTATKSQGMRYFLTRKITELVNEMSLTIPGIQGMRERRWKHDGYRCVKLCTLWCGVFIFRDSGEESLLLPWRNTVTNTQWGDK